MLLNAHGLSSLFKIGRQILFNMGGFWGKFGRYRVIKRLLLFCIFRIPFFALVVTQNQSKKNFWRTQLLDMHC